MEFEPRRTALDVSCTPWDALRALRGDPHPFALVGEWAGGGAIVGSAPLRLASGFEPLPALPAGDVVGGGWFGRIGFPLGQTIEEVGPPPPRPVPVAAVGTGFYDHVVRLDRAGRWWFECLWTPERDAALAARREELARRLATPPAALPFRLSGVGVRAPGWAGHAEGVREALECIRAGEIFQVNLCVRIDGRLEGSALDLFCAAAERLEPRFGAFADIGGAAVASLSPELFLRRRGRVVETEPIKGTAPRDVAGAREELIASGKDAAEHVMIVDLMRNDLGRVCEYGSVEADRQPRVEAHPGVWHLVSTVRGVLRDGVDDGQLLRASFPPGSVTGAPKVQAIKVLHRLEATGREAYTGAIGFASPVWGTELNVAIRTFEISGEAVWLGAGGGIVADSDPAAEVLEAWRKAAPLVAAAGAELPPPGGVADRRSHSPSTRHAPVLAWRPDARAGLLETIAVRDGRAVRAAEHLRRLAGSAAVLRYAPQTAHDAESLGLLAAGLGDGRLRVVHRSDGSTAVEAVAEPPAPPAPVLLRAVTLPGGLGPHKLADRGGLPSDALLCDLDGHVLEGAWGNVVIAEGDDLVTPPADGRLLAGLTLAQLPVRAEPITLRRLAAADAVLVTSAVRLVTAAGVAQAAAPRAEALAARLRGELLGAPALST